MAASRSSGTSWMRGERPAIDRAPAASCRRPLSVSVAQNPTAAQSSTQSKSLAGNRPAASVATFPRPIALSLVGRRPEGRKGSIGMNVGHAAGLLESDGEMGALIRAKDWSSTPIGPAENWSPSLRMMVGFMLANRFPLLLWWGPQYVSLYNDAYRPILGEKHPRSLGQPAKECWLEIWQVLEPLIDAPFQGGPSTWMDDLPLELNRYGFVEETHFTVAYSPVPDDTAPHGIGGVLATVHE